MAQNQKPEELRREVLASLERARVEMTVQAAELRHDLNPAEVARSAFHKHPGWVIGGAAGAGLVIGWLLLRKREAPAPQIEIRSPIEVAPRRSMAARALGVLLPTSLLGPVAAMAVKAALPSLLKAGMKYYHEKNNPNHL